MLCVIPRINLLLVALVAALMLCAAGCVATEQERISDYNNDGLFLFQQGDYVGARESFKAALADGWVV